MLWNWITYGWFSVVCSIEIRVFIIIISRCVSLFYMAHECSNIAENLIIVDIFFFGCSRG